MEKHFCSCTDTKCPAHPINHENGCDPCIVKNLKQGEIPACFWHNVTNGVIGTSDYSAGNFAKFYLDNAPVMD